MKPAPDALAAALEKAEALSYDGEAFNVRCLVDADGADAEGLERVLRSLEALGGEGAEVAAVKAKIMLGLGRGEEAAALLEGPGSAAGLPARAWLGQALLLSGRFAEALKVLDRAVGEDKSYAWALFFRGAAKLALGDAAGSARDAEGFLKKDASSAGPALAALAASAAGRPEDAARFMRLARERGPDRAWPLVLEAAMRRAANDPHGAKEALVKAAAMRPSAALYAELARTHEQLGVLPDAIASAAEAVRLCPCVEHHCLKAHLHGCWRENALEIAEYDRALALRPGDSSLLFSRSKARSAAGRPDEALADARAAAKALPGDANLESWVIQLLTVTGRGAEAGRRAAALPEAEAHFTRGYAALCAKDAAGAGRAFERCLALSAGTPLWRKAAFYRVAAGVPLKGPGRRKAVQPGLQLIGLGVDPPYTATADALRAIASCDVVFNNVMGDEMFEFLRPFCRDVRPVAYHQNNDEARLSSEILASVRPGRTIAFVTRGSAIVQGPLGTMLLARCASAGISWSCAAAVSSSDLLSSRHADTARRERGQAVVDSRGVPGSPLGDPAVPMTLFLNMSEPAAQYNELCLALKSRYGAGHPCLVLDHVIGQTPRRTTVGELPGLAGGLSDSAIFYVPGITP